MGSIRNFTNTLFHCLKSWQLKSVLKVGSTNLLPLFVPMSLTGNVICNVIGNSWKGNVMCQWYVLPSYAEGGGTKVDTSVFANVFEMSFTYYECHIFFFPLYRYYILGAISFIEWVFAHHIFSVSLLKFFWQFFSCSLLSKVVDTVIDRMIGCQSSRSLISAHRLLCLDLTVVGHLLIYFYQSGRSLISDLIVGQLAWTVSLKNQSTSINKTDHWSLAVVVFSWLDASGSAFTIFQLIHFSSSSGWSQLIQLINQQIGWS